MEEAVFSPFSYTAVLEIHTANMQSRRSEYNRINEDYFAGAGGVPFAVAL
jgi:hypothetical protein